MKGASMQDLAPEEYVPMKWPKRVGIATWLSYP